MADDPRGVVELVARESYGRLVAFLSARTRDVAAAEDALSEAFVTALRTWPRDGEARGVAADDGAAAAERSGPP